MDRNLSSGRTTTTLDMGLTLITYSDGRATRCVCYPPVPSAPTLKRLRLIHAPERAMNDSCMFHACGSPGAPGILKTQPVADMNKCSVQNTVTEDAGIDGWISELPGQMRMPMKFTA